MLFGGVGEIDDYCMDDDYNFRSVFFGSPNRFLRGLFCDFLVSSTRNFVGNSTVFLEDVFVEFLFKYFYGEDVGWFDILARHFTSSLDLRDGKIWLLLDLFIMVVGKLNHGPKDGVQNWHFLAKSEPFRAMSN
jgi:hypothetical protein